MIQRYEFAAVPGEWCKLRDHEADKAAAVRELQRKLDDTEQTRKGLARIYEVTEAFHWRLVDLFDKDMRGVEPLHYLEKTISETLAENAQLRAEIALRTNKGGG